MNKTEGCEVPSTGVAKNDSTIFEQLDIIEKDICRVGDLLGALHNKLSPVLAETPEEEKTESVDTNAISDVAARLRSSDNMITDIMRRVDYLIRVLDL